MDSNENENGQSSGGDVYYNTTYVVDTSNIETQLDLQEGTIEEIKGDIERFNENYVGGIGVLVGLFGLILGFNAAKELLKIWLH